MRGNGKVFVSHAYFDNDRCQPLLAALASCGMDTWFQSERDEADEALSPKVEQALAERDLFLRVCSPDAERSHWVRLETECFRRLQAEERTEGGTSARTMVFVRLDARAEPPTLEEGDCYVDAAGASPLRWRLELRRALGMEEPTPLAAEDGPENADDEAGTATMSLPRVARTEVLADLRALAEQLRMRGPEDSVVSVGMADREECLAEGGVARPALLEVIEGSHVGRKYEIGKPRITLGRKLDRDIFLMDLAVSRRHAAIERDEQGRFVLHDDHSTNGTYVNDRPVTEHILAHGDLIRLGKTTFRVRLPRRDD